MAATRNIHFFFQGTRITLSDRTRLKTFIHKLLQGEGKKLVSLNYIFCTDQALLKINQEHLGHDFYTDIITFELSENRNEIVAEIYISVDRVKENANTLGIPLKHELLRVMFHGALHLCGFKDKKPTEIKKMRKMEDQWLTRFFKGPTN